MYRFSGRPRAVVVNVIAVAVCLFVVSGAGAKVIPSISTTLTLDQVIPTGSSGATTTIAIPAVQLGQHADLTVTMNFGYGATGTITDPNPKYPIYEDPATYPQPSSQWESLSHVVVKTPPGLVGNPNALPAADRCDLSTFETAICPNSATVGTFGIRVIQFGDSEANGGPTYMAPGDGGLVVPINVPGLKNISGSFTKVSLIRSDPEVPALIGIYVQPPFPGAFGPIRTLMKVAPDTNGDLRLVTTTPDGISNELPPPASAVDQTPIANFRIDFMQLKLFGRLPNGRAFMTNPTQCKPWVSQIWADAKKVNDNLDADPLGSGSNDFKAGNTSSITPDCTNGDTVPFPIAGNVSISSPDRDTSPAFDFTITDPGVQDDGDGTVSTTPKKIVTTIPASINVDVQQLGRVCQVANFNADTCPASSRVGSVKIDTPLLLPGLSGDVYLVKENSSSGLPDLGLRVRGAITFTQRGSNRYVGAMRNQIETTFDNIPQIGFSKLTFHLDGGPQGLLRSLSCPTYNKAPAVPTFTYNFYAYTGAFAQSTTPLNMANCFGIQTLKKYPKCLHGILPIHPNYQSRTRVQSVVLKIDGKRKAKSVNSPFRFDLPIKKLKLKKKKGNKHKFELRATYDDGTVSVKQSTFRTCGV